MGSYGKSYPAPTTSTTATTTAANAEAIKDMADSVKHLRRKVAMHIDNFVEPDDIAAQDTERNTEREA
jgi:hypothetical protein